MIFCNNCSSFMDLYILYVRRQCAKQQLVELQCLGKKFPWLYFTTFIIFLNYAISNLEAPYYFILVDLLFPFKENIPIIGVESTSNINTFNVNVNSFCAVLVVVPFQNNWISNYFHFFINWLFPFFHYLFWFTYKGSLSNLSAL